MTFGDFHEVAGNIAYYTKQLLTLELQTSIFAKFLQQISELNLTTLESFSPENFLEIYGKKEQLPIKQIANRVVDSVDSKNCLEKISSLKLLLISDEQIEDALEKSNSICRDFLELKDESFDYIDGIKKVFSRKESLSFGCFLTRSMI